LGLRALVLVLRTRLAAVSLTVKCPLLFMIPFLSSFQASAWWEAKQVGSQLAEVKALSLPQSPSRKLSS
jgi:hypothetical protein